jgi:hypothetical protein
MREKFSEFRYFERFLWYLAPVTDVFPLYRAIPVWYFHCLLFLPIVRPEVTFSVANERFFSEFLYSQRILWYLTSATDVFPLYRPIPVWYWHWLSFQSIIRPKVILKFSEFAGEWTEQKVSVYIKQISLRHVNLNVINHNFSFNDDFFRRPGPLIWPRTSWALILKRLKAVFHSH